MILPEAIIPVAPLPGNTKQLHHPTAALRSERRKRKHWRLGCISFWIWCVAFLLFSWAVLLATVYNHLPSALSGITLKNFIHGVGPSQSFNCNAWTTSSWAQSYFMINIFSFSGLEFWHAKLIEAVWDLVIGQFGRFVHGWILWRYVVSPGMTLLMESSTMPYSAVVNLSFSTVSLFTVRDTLISIWQQKGFRAKAIQWWFIYAILYTLAFPTLWGATSGYINPTTTVFRAPDGNFLYPVSDSLQLCYSLDTERLGSNVSKVVLGPTLLELSQQVQKNKGHRQDGLSINISSSFRDVLHYTVTQRLVEYAIATRWNTTNVTGDSFDFTAANQTPRLDKPIPSLPRGLSGYRLCGSGEPGCSNSSDVFPWGIVSTEMPKGWTQNVFTLSKALFDIQTDGLSMPVKPTEMAFGSDIAAAAIENRTGRIWPPYQEGPYLRYQYDDWLTNPVLFPYNSSFWFEGRLHTLSAPFLDVSKGCIQIDYAAPACLCYAGKPLAYEFLTVNSDSMGCLSESSDYSWGFGSVILATALVAEFIWIIGCWAVWIDAEKRSVLINHRRSTAGDIRKILDIAASINHDLGTDTVANSETELKRALEKCEMVGHEMHEGERTKGMVGVLTRRHAGQVRRKKGAESKVTMKDLGSLETL